MSESQSTSVDRIDEVIAGYQAIRDFLAEHPDLPEASASNYGPEVSMWLHRYAAEGDTPEEQDQYIRTEFARCARILLAGAPVGSIRKDVSDYSQSIVRSFGPVSLIVYASRDAVCEKRVIGTEKVQVPDPAAPTVEVEREIVEWVCAPILPDEREVAAAHYADLADEAKAQVSA